MIWLTDGHIKCALRIFWCKTFRESLYVFIDVLLNGHGALSERTCGTLYPWMEFDLHGPSSRTEVLPVVASGTSINDTIHLQSDFEVRLYNSYFYIHHFVLFGSLLVIHAQHAPGNPSHVSHHPFHVLTVIWTDGLSVDHKLMIDWFEANNKNVGNRWCIVKVYPSH